MADLHQSAPLLPRDPARHLSQGKWHLDLVARSRRTAAHRDHSARRRYAALPQIARVARFQSLPGSVTDPAGKHFLGRTSAMGIEQNKELVTKTWEAFVKGDIKTAFANMSDQVSWLVPGSIPKVSGLHQGKDQIIAFLSAIGPVVPNGMQTEIRRLYG